MIDRPLQPPVSTKARDAARLRRALSSDDGAVSAGRRLGRLVTQGFDFDHPAVVATADELRGHLQRFIELPGSGARRSG